MQLVECIKHVFKSDIKIYLDASKPLNKKTLVKFLNDKDIVPIGLTCIYWEQVINEKKYLDSIIEWYQHSSLFDYFLPALLIHIINNQYREDEVLLCVIDRLSPEFLAYNECRYIDKLYEFTSDQRRAISSFITECYKINASIEDTYLSVIEALNYIDEINRVIDYIYDSYHYKMKGEYIVSALESRDGHEIFQLLKDKSWIALIEDRGDIVKNINYGYVYLYLDSALYFLPSYMVLSLKFTFENVDFTEYAIGLISRIISMSESVLIVDILGVENIKIIDAFLLAIAKSPFVKFSYSKQVLECLNWTKQYITSC